MSTVSGSSRSGGPAPTAISAEVGRASIAEVRKVIAPYVRRTPIIEVNGADLGVGDGVRLFLKLELCQHTGSFKPRGAFANLLLRKPPAAGVVAASGGNHGVAVAYAAMRLGIPARIFVPVVASPVKMQQIRGYGAQLVVGGDLYADALEASERWVASSGAMPVHAYDQAETVLGAGSIGAELQEQVPDADTVLIAVGGGGLLGGVATWYAGAEQRKTRVMGVEPELAPTMTRALAVGAPVDAEAGGIAADSLAPRRVGQVTFPIARDRVDRVVLVSDAAIRAAQESLWRALRIVAEPGGAAAVAAVLAGGYRPARGERVAVVICGGNTTAVDFAR